MARLIEVNGLWIIRDEWCADDILEQAEDIGVELTPNEVYQVMIDIVKCHDSNVGINNESIRAHIDCVEVYRKYNRSKSE